MCGRFTQAYTWAEINALLDLTGLARNLRPHYNLAPTDTIDVARLGVGGRELIPMRWGFIPSWWGRPLNELPATFNARAETVAVKAMLQSRISSASLHHPGVGLLRVDRAKEGTNAALFFIAIRRATRLRWSLGELARSYERRDHSLRDDHSMRRQSMDGALPRSRASVARAERLRPLAFRRRALREWRL